MRGSRKCSSTSSPILGKRTRKSSPITSRRPTRSLAPSSISSRAPSCRRSAPDSSRRSRSSKARLRLIATQPRSRERIRLELGVYRTLGGINAEHRGFSSADCGSAYTTALALCRELGDAPELFSVLSGLGSYEITRAGFATCRELAQECLSRGADQQAKPPIVMGHLLLGGTLFLQAELAAAREHLEEALRLYDADMSASRGKQVLYVQDQKSTGLCYLALTLTTDGRRRRAALAGGEQRTRAFAVARRPAHDQLFVVLPRGRASHSRRLRAALERATQSLRWRASRASRRGSAFRSCRRGRSGRERRPRDRRARRVSSGRHEAPRRAGRGRVPALRDGAARGGLDRRRPADEARDARTGRSADQRDDRRALLRGRAVALARRRSSRRRRAECRRSRPVPPRGHHGGPRAGRGLFALRSGVGLARLTRRRRKDRRDARDPRARCQWADRR